MSIQSFVLIEWLNRNAPPHSRSHNFPGEDACFRSDHGAAQHANVIAEANLTADHAIIFDGNAAADPRLRGDHHALANVAVVTDVHHVVELGSFADSGEL